MTDTRGGYSEGNPSGRRIGWREPGCNDNDDPNNDSTMSLAVPDRGTPNGFVTAASSRRAVAPRRSAQLRELAGWYRDFAERAGSPNIWEARVRTAEDLEDEASRIERVARR